MQTAAGRGRPVCIGPRGAAWMIREAASGARGVQGQREKRRSLVKRDIEVRGGTPKRQAQGSSSSVRCLPPSRVPGHGRMLSHSSSSAARARPLFFPLAEGRRPSYRPGSRLCIVGQLGGCAGTPWECAPPDVCSCTGAFLGRKYRTFIAF